VESSITLAPGAEHNGLAQWLAEALTRAVDGDARGDFDALRAAVAVVAPDRRRAVTMRFDHGHVTLHDGMVGIPDVTFCGDYPVLVALAALPLRRIGPVTVPSFRACRDTIAELASGELRIYGLVTRARVVFRVLRLLNQR
jgi:hypothetical protein